MTKKFITNSISGIWNSVGCPSDEGEGVTLSLKESGIPENDSLIELCGFSGKEKSIGVLSNFFQVSELIVILPMVQLTISEIDPDIPSLEEDIEADTSTSIEYICDECSEINCTHVIEKVITERTKFLPPNEEKKYYYSAIEDAYLFKINEQIINKILNVADYKNYSIRQIKSILYDREQSLNKQNTIVNLLFCMVNYYIPPHLNWLLDKSLPPLAFYCCEFTSNLNRNDLSNIWQGIMPKIAEEPEEEEIEIEHFLMDEEIFGEYDIKNLENAKLSIFKCKKIAKSNYNEYISGKSVENNDNWYNYNWPYDDFSLIEYARVELSEVYDDKQENQNSVGVLKLSENG